jgi:hypothetical protein
VKRETGESSQLAYLTSEPKAQHQGFTIMRGAATKNVISEFVDEAVEAATVCRLLMPTNGKKARLRPEE